jgi:hypothetical protein
MLSRERGHTALVSWAYEKNHFDRFFDLQEPLDKVVN